MRALPQLTPGQKSTQLTTTFMGYNHNEIIEDGEMYDMKNLSGDLAPILAPRKKREIMSLDPEGGTSVPLTGIHGRDQLVFVRGSDVYYNFMKVANLSVSTADNMVPKKIVSFGAYVCIWPDRKYFNTADLSDQGSMERLFDVNGEYASVSLCRGDGTDYDMSQVVVSSEEPANPANGQLWIDQSGEEDVLRQWMSTMQEWLEVGTTYIKISATGIGAGLREYDVVTISGMKALANQTGKHVGQIDALNGANIVYFAGENYIIVMGLLSRSQGELYHQTIRVDRTLPELDYVCESNNRLWGCHYGLVNGTVVNEIYASALGDFRNWYRFMGNSQDSFTASVGTDGPFTGVITQRGYPVFFKEDCIHRVSGQTPGTFSITTTICRGVQRGCYRSLAVVNEAIYYKSRQDVMRYDGSMPVSVGEKLGISTYSDARAGAIGDKYYISMLDGRNVWTHFVYNTVKGLWFKEDNLHALGYGKAGDELYLIDEDNNTLVSVNGIVVPLAQDGTWTRSAEESVPWSATFGLTGAEYGRGSTGGRVRKDITNRRYMSRFVLRIYVEPGSKVYMDIKYEAEDWERVGEITGDQLDSHVVPILPRRCDHLRFRLTGTGYSRIYSISRELEVAGDG